MARDRRDIGRSAQIEEELLEFAERLTRMGHFEAANLVGAAALSIGDAKAGTGAASVGPRGAGAGLSGRAARFRPGSETRIKHQRIN